MRERHNITRNEVGQPQPPIYMRQERRRRRGRQGVMWMCLGVSLVAFFIMAALVS